MFFEVIVILIGGIFIGIFAGLIPGLHTNTIAPLFAVLLQEEPAPIMLLFLLSIGITQTIADAIPSVFLGAPDPDLVVGVLPSHQLFNKGMGYEAVRILAIGSLSSLVLSVIFTPILIFMLESLFYLIKPIIVWLLILLITILLLKQNSRWGFIVFSLSGVLGTIVLNSKIKEPLMPLLSGLFGASGLILSIYQKQAETKQYITEFFRFNKKNCLSVVGSVCAASIINLFPGLGPSQATALVQPLFAKKHPFVTLLFVGGVNTADFVISLVMFYVLGKTRNGTLATLKTIHPFISGLEFIFGVLALILAGSIGVMITLGIARLFINSYNKMPKTKITICVLLFVVLLNAYFSGWKGIIILIIATGIGLIAPLTNTPRSLAMGVLLVPTIMYYLGF